MCARLGARLGAERPWLTNINTLSSSLATTLRYNAQPHRHIPLSTALLGPVGEVPATELMQH